MKRTVTKSISTFRAVRVEAGFDPSKEFVVCPWGEVQTRKGPVTVNEHTLAVFEANQKAERRDKVAGDFNHNFLRVPLKDHPVNVSGYFTVRCERGRGIIATLAHETPHMQAVRDGSYPDISPAVERDANGVVEGLHSFAFCNQGEMAHPDLEIFSIESPTPKTPTMTDTEMLCSLLSDLTGETLAADASAETKMAALAKAKGAKAPPAEMNADANKELTALAVIVTDLKKTVDTFAAKDGERAVMSLIAAAQSAGKKIGLKPERLVLMGAEGAKEYLDTLTAGEVKPDAGSAANQNLEAANKGKPGKGDKVTDVFSADTLKMWRRNGIDPEDMLKRHNERVALAAETTEAVTTAAD